MLRRLWRGQCHEGRAAEDEGEDLMGSDEPQFLGLCEIGRRIQKRQLSSVEVTKALI